MKQRLDQRVMVLGLVASRSQAESFIKLGEVTVNGKIVTKPGLLVSNDTIIKLTAKEQYVSRAALKLASVAQALKLEFTDKIVLDVGSSTGGFTEYCLRQGAKQVIAIEVGTDQLHPSLRSEPRIELHEKTDIRDVQPFGTKSNHTVLSAVPDIVVADVSFVSLRDILPHLQGLVGPQTRLLMMVKPQFEASQSSLKHKGVIKNDAMRRTILKDFERWLKPRFIIIDKADSGVPGAKGNQERFYLLRKSISY
jgi:23S rRNA (cytidine1920-2'-O)/16S rRNA (cytidine1409-2'-O)-methyltransferase